MKLLGKKIGLTSIGGVLHNSKGEVPMWFSKHVGVKKSSERQALPILEALRLFVLYFQEKLVVERNSSMLLLWLHLQLRTLVSFIPFSMKLRCLLQCRWSLSIKHVLKTAKGLVDSLACLVPLLDSSL